MLKSLHLVSNAYYMYMYNKYLVYLAYDSVCMYVCHIRENIIICN